MLPCRSYRVIYLGIWAKYESGGVCLKTVFSSFKNRYFPFVFSKFFFFSRLHSVFLFWKLFILVLSPFFLPFIFFDLLYLCTCPCFDLVLNLVAFAFFFWTHFSWLLSILMWVKIHTIAGSFFNWYPRSDFSTYLYVLPISANVFSMPWWCCYLC